MTSSKVSPGTESNQICRHSRRLQETVTSAFCIPYFDYGRYVLFTLVSRTHNTSPEVGLKLVRSRIHLVVFVNIVTTQKTVNTYAPIFVCPPLKLNKYTGNVYLFARDVSKSKTSATMI